MAISFHAFKNYSQCDYNELFQNCQEVLQFSGFLVKKVGAHQGYIKARTRMGWVSPLCDIIVRVNSNGTVYVQSATSMKTAIVDGGQNRKNVEKFFNNLDLWLGVITPYSVVYKIGGIDKAWTSFSTQYWDWKKADNRRFWISLFSIVVAIFSLTALTGLFLNNWGVASIEFVALELSCWVTAYILRNKNRILMISFFWAVIVSICLLGIGWFSTIFFSLATCDHSLEHYNCL